LSRNLGTLTSWNPLGHSKPVTGLLYLYIIKKNSVATSQKTPTGSIRVTKPFMMCGEKIVVDCDITYIEYKGTIKYKVSQEIWEP
jgi:hypothetical protein